MKNYIISILILVYFNTCYSQGIKDSSICFPMFTAEYGIQLPGGDMAKRFGVNSVIGGKFLYKFQSNLLIGITGNVLYGNNLKEKGILDSLRTTNGEIINKFGEYANIVLSERGFIINGSIGQIFPLKKLNPNSGIFISLSGGLLQHKIRIDNDGNNAWQIYGDYKKGYDRLTNGFSLTEFFGLQYFSKHQFINFYAGIELTQAWTKNRRDFNFDTRQKDTMQRHDYLYSFKVGWIIPIYSRYPADYYYY